MASFPEPGNLREIAEALEVLEMSVEEAEIYLYLLQAGPSKVGQLAPAFDVSRSKLYRLLDDLSRKGFVSKTPTRPTVYHPVSPQEAFEIGEKTLDRRHEYLSSVRDELLGPLQRLHKAVEAPETTDWTKVPGGEHIYEAIHRVVGEAERSLALAVNRDPAFSLGLPFVWEAWSEIQRVVDQGVEPRFLVGPPDRSFEDVPAWALETDRTRAVDLGHPLHFVLVDEEVVVFWVEMAPARGTGSGENVAIETNAPPTVGTHAMLFERLWSQARPADDPR